MAPHSCRPSSFVKSCISFSDVCQVGFFLRRHKRFSVAVRLNNREEWCHSNNTGSMLGLLREGSPVLLSPASNPKRKLAWTQEAVWLGSYGRDAKSMLHNGALPHDSVGHDIGSGDGFWVGVNTSIPNAMLSAAFAAGALPFAAGYTRLVREAKRGDSRLDGCFTGEGRAPLWVECKNVTMVEDDVACFPDAATVRGQKHLRELMNIVRAGERAAMFYLVQRPDGRCFAPADFIDPDYAALFWEARSVGVEIYVYTAHVAKTGISLGSPLPIVPAP